MIFKCNKHGAIISDKLLSFYKENELCDTVLIAGSNSVNIQAHKLVLCALSEYFLEKLRSDHTVLQGAAVVLKKIEASTLKLVIDFMYTGSIELSLRNVEELLRTALVLKMKTLTEGCCDFIEENINSSNSLQWFRISNELSLSTLKAKSLECHYTNFEKICKEKELLMLNKNELKDLLFNDNHHGNFEKEIFLSTVAWINYDKSNREQLVFELLSMVRYWLLTPKFIVENRKSFCKTVEIYELICSWLQWHLSPETRSNSQPKCVLKKNKINSLAVIGSVNGEIIIQTFNRKENSWFFKTKKCLSHKVYHSSMIVIDSKLLVVGGIMHDGGSNNNRVNRVQCLDRHMMMLIDFPPMKNKRMLSQLADLNGHLCVFSGDNANSMEMYNFSTCQWHDLQPPSQISRNSSIAALNGMLFILDFVNGLLLSYDVSSDKWTSKAVGKKSLQCFGLTAVEGYLYVLGGCDENLKYVKTAKRYDLSNDSWHEIASLPRACYVSTKVFKDKIRICDGNTVEEYCIDSNTWRTLGSLTIKVEDRCMLSILTTEYLLKKKN